MTEDQDSKETVVDAGSKTFINKGRDRKSRLQRPLTKIVVRRLPPTMTEETFLEQVSPIPDHDHFYFAKPDPSLGVSSYSRAYINFVNVDDIYLFRDKFDGYVFLDAKGVEYVGIVEYAPFQRIPKKKKKKDPKCGTIESDPVYKEFLDSLKDPEPDSQPKLEYSYPVNEANEKKVTSTPLLDFLAARKQDKRNRDERRRRENDKRKMRILKPKDGPIKEEESTEADTKKGKRDWEKSKTKDDVSKSPDGAVYESKSYKEQRKAGAVSSIDKKKNKDDKKEATLNDEDVTGEDKSLKKDKESPRETKSKKYSESRKERLKQSELLKDKSTFGSKTSDKGVEVKSTKTMNHEDIKPFTQLPQVKTDDLAKVIDEMDRKMKLEDQSGRSLSNEEDVDEFKKTPEMNTRVVKSRIRRNSLNLDEPNMDDDNRLIRQKSLDDSSKSSREDSVEKDKGDNAEHRSERRIRNKDRPSLVIYQPGMGMYSKQRLAKDKNPNVKSINESEKRDT